MALDAYLKLKGKSIGDIKGGVTRKGLEGAIKIIGVDHETATPYDITNFKMTGKRQYRPLVLTKEIDITTPKLNQALAVNENFSEFILRFYGAATTGSLSGVETNIYTITLTNASVLKIELHMYNNKDAQYKDMPVIEKVAFSFEQIEWKWFEGNSVAKDGISAS